MRADQARHDAYRRGLQQLTRRAGRYAQPWTVHDDLTLYLSTHSIAETARALGRTYYATSHRRTTLLDPSSEPARRLAAYLSPGEAPERRQTA